jgi:hypothetical protein
MISLLLSACAPNPPTATAPAPTDTDVPPVASTSTPAPTVIVEPSATTEDPRQPMLDFRRVLGLPDLPLEFVETTRMVNSPTGLLPVYSYRDPEGRTFLFEPSLRRVVEVDARAVLSLIPADAPVLTLDELRERALGIANASPMFLELQADLAYEEGPKGLFFFQWSVTDSPTMVFKRPFLQIGLHGNGDVIAYYNTLGLP